MIPEWIPLIPCHSGIDTGTFHNPWNFAKPALYIRYHADNGLLLLCLLDGQTARAYTLTNMGAALFTLRFSYALPAICRGAQPLSFGG
jgi:hypothetical protein